MCSIGAKSHILAFTRRMGAWHRQHGDPGTSLQTDHTANRIRSSHGNKKNHLSGARRIRRSPAGLCTLVLRQRGASSESDSESSDTIAVTAPVVSPRRHRRAAGRTRRIDGGARQTGRTHQTRRVGRAGAPAAKPARSPKHAMPSRAPKHAASSTPAVPAAPTSQPSAASPAQTGTPNATTSPANPDGASSSSGTSDSHRIDAPSQVVRDYWTPERMRNAQPAPMPSVTE